jgi:hypothetical protein
MTTRRKWACLAAAGIAAALLVLFFLTRRTDRREREAASPPDSQLQATKTPRAQRTHPEKPKDEGTPSHSRLTDIVVASISGRLIDAEGNRMENDAALHFQGLYQVVGQGIKKAIVFEPDGTYEVKDLPVGTYFVRLSPGAWRGEIGVGARRYWPHKEPENIHPGTTDADIVVMSGNPGAVRGKVLSARTMLPVQRFTVYHKYDYASAQDRARRCNLVGLLKHESSGVPDLDEYRARRDSYRERLESLGLEQARKMAG